MCEKKLKSIGGPDYIGGSDHDPAIFRKVLAFKVIMESDLAREYLKQFFEKETNEEGRNLLRFAARMSSTKLAPSRHQNLGMMRLETKIQ